MKKIYSVLSIPIEYSLSELRGKTHTTIIPAETLEEALIQNLAVLKDRGVALNKLHVGWAVTFASVDALIPEKKIYIPPYQEPVQPEGKTKIEQSMEQMEYCTRYVFDKADATEEEQQTLKKIIGAFRKNVTLNPTNLKNN